MREILFRGKRLTELLKGGADKENPIVTFAKKLKECAFECDVSFGFGKEHCKSAVSVIDIDNLLKEMTEGKNG